MTAFSTFYGRNKSFGFVLHEHHAGEITKCGCFLVLCSKNHLS